MKSWVVYEVTRSSIHGPAITSTIPVTTIFGTNVSVISWICVAACRIETREADDQARRQERQRELEAEPHGLHGQVDRNVAMS